MMNQVNLKVMAALVMVALAAAASGCASGSSSSKTKTTTTVPGVSAEESWATTTPRATGPLTSVKWDLPYGEPSTLDYLQAASWSENTVLSSLCEGLLRTRPDLTIEPSLAEKIEHPNPTTYIYQLRPGVKFTDGKPMTAADAVFSLRRNMDPKLGSFWSGWFVNVKNIAATGPLTVKVTLTKPDVMFNQFMATAAGTIAEKTYIQKEGKKYGSAQGGVMCTGPFKLTKWTPSQSITIERNDHYWDSAHMAKTMKIEFEFLTDSSAINAALQSGQIDGTYDAPLTVSSSSAGKVYLGHSTQFVAGAYTARPGPIQDVRIREALSLAIDRAAIAKTIFKNSAIPIFSAFTPGTWSYAKATFAKQAAQLPSPAGTNIAKAKALVQKVGKVRPIDLMVSAGDAAEDQLAIYMQAQAKVIGLRMKVHELPPKQYTASAFDPKLLNQYDIALGGGYDDVADPLVQAVWELLPGSPFNGNHYNNPTVTKLIGKARETANLQKRAAILGKIGQQAYGKDYSQLMVVNLAERLFLGKRVTGVPASLPSYLYYPWSRDLGAAGG
jgi:peptide/nickel transport system substrate-binding protein